MDIISIDKDLPSHDEEFEKQIAYFFGVKDEKPVSRAFIRALNELSLAEHDNLPLEIENQALAHIVEAYRLIAEQQKWDFDIHAAAKLELQIIWGLQTQTMSFERIQELSTELYTIVFKSDSPKIKKAVMLRTFLYQYKTEVQKINPIISATDKLIMLNLALMSGKYLNSIQAQA